MPQATHVRQGWLFAVTSTGIACALANQACHCRVKRAHPGHTFKNLLSSAPLLLGCLVYALFDAGANRSLQVTVPDVAARPSAQNRRSTDTIPPKCGARSTLGECEGAPIYGKHPVRITKSVPEPNSIHLYQEIKKLSSPKVGLNQVRCRSTGAYGTKISKRLRLCPFSRPCFPSIGTP